MSKGSKKKKSQGKNPKTANNQSAQFVPEIPTAANTLSFAPPPSPPPSPSPPIATLNTTTVPTPSSASLRPQRSLNPARVLPLSQPNQELGTRERSIHRIRFLIFLLLFPALLLTAYHLRTTEIETRPLHSDESVNFLFYETIKAQKYYPYSHENYHGPLYFYVLTGLIDFFKDSVFSLRVTSAYAGVLTILALLLWLPREGVTFVLISALLLTLSPSMVFHARYAIHEPMLVMFSALFAGCVYNWILSKHPRWVYFIALSLAGLILVKETFIITVFAVGIASLFISHPLTVFYLLWTQRNHVFLASLVAAVPTIGIFTAGFRWPEGAYEMLLAIPQWVGRSHSDVGHVKPFSYYIASEIWPTEPYLVICILGFIGILAASFFRAIVREEGLSTWITDAYWRSARFFALWFLTTLFVYSCVPYKTAWLIINMTLPGTLFTAQIITNLLGSYYKSRPSGMHYLGALALLVSVIVGTNNMLRYNFSNLPIFTWSIPVANAVPYGEKNPFSYVHTSPGTLEVVKRVLEYWQKQPTARVLIGVDGSFPLPFYLRSKASQCAYTTNFGKIEDEAKNYDIMILDFYKHKWDEHDKGPEVWTRDYYRMSDYQEAFLYMKKLP